MTCISVSYKSFSLTLQIFHKYHCKLVYVHVYWMSVNWKLNPCHTGIKVITSLLVNKSSDFGQLRNGVYLVPVSVFQKRQAVLKDSTYDRIWRHHALMRQRGEEEWRKKMANKNQNHPNDVIKLKKTEEKYFHLIEQDNLKVEHATFRLLTYHGLSNEFDFNTKSWLSL